MPPKQRPDKWHSVSLGRHVSKLIQSERDSGFFEKSRICANNLRTENALPRLTPARCGVLA